MLPVAPYFVEHVGRMYEVVEAEAAPTGRDGMPRKCVMNLSEQRFEFAPGVPVEDRESLICRAITIATGQAYSSLVPFRGVARADGEPV